ncbi:pyruvate dehydrogenase E1 component alpha subunit [Plasticicumulans lactativorans]|uniref:Pyruvate dehydrogenase E1 component subunit alpha n=1 Tax=Plasticicumulans lactativorans TaxID=1133106 RepID=A0A4R2L3V9_9GAMM|nr:pyruvate dehydrogenase (acetyl-transferring) E1 component subunit alpha [Plasticicumulans lactativorans]TCO80412.1 pyruvate dehydrogenase E1 component alpha subunit [Plasticicumulans lactativorans]
MTVVARFEIHGVRYLDAAGHPCAELPPLGRDREHLVALYRAMVQARSFDAKAVVLQRTGRIGTYASALGQEAIGVCIADVLRAEDVLLPSYRETAAMLGRGVHMDELLLYWGGDERGMDFAGPREDFPICVPIATQLTHAAGVAAAFQYRGEARVALAVCGDGATSQGDFYAALNLAGAWRLPLVVVVNNNQWAISVPRSAQSGTETLAQKALAAGITGVQCDGNDVLALHETLAAAVARAREGGGATLVEALSYRLGDHTTADDASRYRDPDEVEARRQEEPVVRLRRYLHAQGWWDAGVEEALKADCAATVDAAVARYEATPPPAPTAMFDHLYARLPAALAAQRAAAAAGGGHG